MINSRRKEDNLQRAEAAQKASCPHCYFADMRFDCGRLWICVLKDRPQDSLPNFMFRKPMTPKLISFFLRPQKNLITLKMSTWKPQKTGIHVDILILFLIYKLFVITDSRDRTFSGADYDQIDHSLSLSEDPEAVPSSESAASAASASVSSLPSSPLPSPEEVPLDASEESKVLAAISSSL